MQELLKPISRGTFDRLVRQHRADKHSKGFGGWDHLVAMVYAQLSGASSLRDLVAGFNSQSAHHYHLGTADIRRSTLAEANAKRTSAVFEDLARSLMAQAGRALRHDGQALQYLLDSSPISLKGRGFDTWAAGTATRRTQGFKLHLLLSATAATPARFSLSAPNVNDINAGRTLPIEAGATYVFDKGYCDYSWWAQLHAQGARFVTRFKSNAALTCEHTVPIPAGHAAGVLSDEIVRFTYRHPGGGRRNTYTERLRRVTVHRPDHARPLVLATNDLTTPAREIAELYKARWQVELFFKWVKQHLKIKRFLGQSENAVRIQVVCALIAYLLLTLYRQAHGVTVSMWSLLSELRASLFQRPSIEHALHRKRQARRRFLAEFQPGLFT